LFTEQVGHFSIADLGHFSKAPKLKRAEKQAARLEYCVECAELAASLLSECPYIDMSRPDQLVFSGEGMEWRPRSVEIPDNKVPVTIDERRRALMGV
jgi:hypothetical protein